MRVAYLIDNVVMEMREINRPIEDYPQVHLVEAGEEVAVGFTWDGTIFTPHATHQAELDKAAQDTINQEARDYLASTDWMVLREADDGTAITAEIKQLRADARIAIIKETI